MKRVASILILLASIAAVAKSQFFVEGSFDAGFNSSRYLYLYHSDTDTPSNIFLNISPLTGYQLNDKISAGAKASVVRRKEKKMGPDPDTGNEVEWELRTPEWNLAVFCRYKIMGKKKFSFLVESSIFIGGNNFIEKKGAIIHREETQSSIGFNMLPLVTCDLTEKFSLIAKCEFLSLDLSTQTQNDKANSWVIKSKHFGFTGKTVIYNFLPSVGIGFIYHFNQSNK